METNWSFLVVFRTNDQFYFKYLTSVKGGKGLCAMVNAHEYNIIDYKYNRIFIVFIINDNINYLGTCFTSCRIFFNIIY